MSTVSAKDVARCEWCEEPASYRITARVVTGTYRRFACLKGVHRACTAQLAVLDLGSLTKRTTMTNPTGFSVAGRVLGP